MPGVREALDQAERSIAEAGSDTARLDAELLAADALGIARAQIYADGRGQMPDAAVRRLDALVARRVLREPVAYILGSWGFRRIELAVDARVLIPRPDSELLVELALGLPDAAHVHDVGTGSGAIALALKHERPGLVVSASDASPDAVEVARLNARQLGLDVPVAVHRGLPPGQYDLVIANLPYVREDEWDGLEPEITGYEPREALVSGADGLDAIRELVSEARPRTALALEHAPAQAAAVRALLDDAVTHRDLAGRERATTGHAQ
ncbi:MAG: peptide chain release factor N(5)-glutamine methyltransferase [Thermoleophilaceae bacterium]